MALSVSEKVQGFAEAVKSFAIQAAESAQVKKLARALTMVADALGDDGLVNVGSADLDYAMFSSAAEALADRESDTNDAASSLAKEARLLESLVENGMVEDGDLEVAQSALTLWGTVRPTSRPMAVKGTARGERASVPDFDFPIFATCEVCGDEVKTGARSGNTDWNSLRHYSQRHGQNVHAAGSFNNKVSNAWRDAKAEFANGESKVIVDGDGDIPGFILEAQEVATAATGA